MLDPHLLVERHRAAYRIPLLAGANRILAPNVFYIEVPFDDRMVRAKHAVVSLTQLELSVTPAPCTPIPGPVLPRPCSCSGCATTIAAGVASAPSPRPSRPRRARLGPWSTGPMHCSPAPSGESYASKLRAERSDRPVALFQLDRDRKDGASHLLWKIERHSGVRHDLLPGRSAITPLPPPSCSDGFTSNAHLDESASYLIKVELHAGSDQLPSKIWSQTFSPKCFIFNALRETRPANSERIRGEVTLPNL